MYRIQEHAVSYRRWKIWSVHVENKKHKQIYTKKHSIPLENVRTNVKQEQLFTNIYVPGCDNR